MGYFNDKDVLILGVEKLLYLNMFCFYLDNDGGAPGLAQIELGIVPAKYFFLRSLSLSDADLR